MQIRAAHFSWSISPKLVKIIEDAIRDAGIPPNAGAVINFRDPNYCPDSGGFHPVEIRINPDGQIEYVTDFALVGRPPDCELTPELNFAATVFEHFGTIYNQSEGRDLFKLWQSNFIEYHKMDVYSVSVRPVE